MKSKLFLMAIMACLMAACSVEDNPSKPTEPEGGPTAKEKAMVPTMMMWQLDSTLVINYPGSLIETYQMLYAGKDTYQWTYTFYPCTYRFPADLVFSSDFEEGVTYQVAEMYKEDYCKYTCTVDGEIISAGYLCYYRDMFTFTGLKQGGWVDFMLREADTKWDSDLWTCTFDAEVEQDGTVVERQVEYYSRVRDK